MNQRRDQIPKKDIMYTLVEDDSQYIVNESYFYKTEPYYAIVKSENEGIISPRARRRACSGAPRRRVQLWFPI